MRKAWPAGAAALILGACGLPAQAQRAMPASGATPGRQPLMLQSPPVDIATPLGYDRGSGPTGSAAQATAVIRLGRADCSFSG